MDTKLRYWVEMMANRTVQARELLQSGELNKVMQAGAEMTVEICEVGWEYGTELLLARETIRGLKERKNK